MSEIEWQHKVDSQGRDAIRGRLGNVTGSVLHLGDKIHGAALHQITREGRLCLDADTFEGAKIEIGYQMRCLDAEND